MKTIKIAGFIRLGEFGGLSATTTKKQVEDMFGPPEACSQEKHGSVVWKFGRVQLFFLREHLVQIFVYYSENTSDTSMSPLILDDDFKANPTLTAFQKFLNEADISWKIIPELTFEKQICMETSAGIKLIFDGEHCTKIGKAF